MSSLPEGEIYLSFLSIGVYNRLDANFKLLIESFKFYKKEKNNGGRRAGQNSETRGR